jgi:hypothetical protein
VRRSLPARPWLELADEHAGDDERCPREGRSGQPVAGEAADDPAPHRLPGIDHRRHRRGHRPLCPAQAYAYVNAHDGVTRFIRNVVSWRR